MAQSRWMRPGPHRTLSLAALGAVAGLLIAGFALFTAKGRSTSLVPPEAVATVNQKPILLSDYVYQLQTELGVSFPEATTEQKRKIMREMVGEELKVQRGVTLDLPGSDPDVRMALVNGVDAITAANVLSHPPTEQDLRRYYAMNLERYRTNGLVTVREVVVPSYAKPELIDQVAAALKAGAPADRLQSLYGARPTGRVAQPTFDETARLRLGRALYGALEGLRPGDVSKPVRSQDGVHLMLVTARIAPLQPAFEDIVKTLYGDYMRDKRRPIEDASLSFLHRQADIRFASGYSE